MNAIGPAHGRAISHPHKKRRRRHTMALMAFAMGSTAVAGARRTAHHITRRRSAIGMGFVPPSTSTFATWSWKHTDSKSLASPTLPISSLPPPIASLPSTALCMAGRRKNANRSRGRSSSGSAVASPPATAADTSANSDSSNNKKKRKKPQKKKAEANTGRLRLLSPLQPSSEILSRASRQTHNEVKDDLKIANVRRRTQKRGAQTIDAFCQKLCAPLKATVQTYRRELKHMHPFERVVMDLTVRARQKRDGLALSAALDEIHEGRKELLQLSKDWIAKIKSSPTARESYECTEEAKEALAEVFRDLIEEPWGGVMELQKSLRNVPIVRLDCPAVVLVGAPNVGKSSIVRAISSGTPEVNNYPFTTRGMTLGHVQVFWESDIDVARGNVAGVSIPSERQLVQEMLVKRGVKTRRVEEEEVREAYSREDSEEPSLEEIESDMEAAMEDVAKSAAGVVEATGNDASRDVDDSIEFEQFEDAPRKPKPIISKKIFPVSQLCQIMDSPGILNRDDPKAVRNEMEELTLAAMAHLPTAVMYVMDLSGGAGDKCSSVEDQLVLRRELRRRFPRRPWIDVVSKVDLGIVEGGKERLLQILEAEHSGEEDVDRYLIELSIKEGWGLEDLRQEVMRMLGEVRVVLDAMAAMDERSARAV